jgi:DNA-binding MurR/RpiR family transcriptional regulator
VLKMFTTQLHGLFQRIQEKQTEWMEDGARLLAQAAVADHTIYIYGTAEMEAVAYEATKGAEPLSHATVLRSDKEIEQITTMDRVLLVSRYSTDLEAIQLAKTLAEKKIPFVAVSSHLESTSETLVDLADVHIDLQLKKGLVPNEDGGRIGYPFSMAALFVYYGLKFTIEEILVEYE